MYKTVILLTACINPNGMEYTKLQDSNIRLRQYKEALNWYIENTEYSIVFVENTDTYIGKDFQYYIDINRIEFITFNGNNFPKHLGKGYGEALIIQKALNESIILRDCDFIVKITGRLIIKNILVLIKESLKAKRFSSLSTLNKDGNNVCASYFFVTPITFLQDFFLSKKDLINDSDGMYFEHVLYLSIVEWIKKGNKFHSFYHAIDVFGVSGSTGKNYPRKTIKSSFKALIKGIFINIVRNERFIFGM